MAGLIIQIRSEPLLDVLDRFTFAGRVIGHLVMIDLSEAKLAGLRVGEIETADT